MKKIKKHDCSNCGAGLWNQYVSVGACPLYLKGKRGCCTNWKPLPQDIELPCKKKNRTEGK